MRKDVSEVIDSDHKKEKKTLCTHRAVGLIQGSLPARANGSQSCEVGLSLLQLSFLYLLQLKREDNEFVNSCVIFYLCFHTNFLYAYVHTRSVYVMDFPDPNVRAHYCLFAF